MYQPYPSSGQAPEPERTGPPSSVVMAVRLMYAGAVVSALSLVVSLATIGNLRTSLHNANPKLTATQLHTLQTGYTVALVAFGLIGIVLWVWMALMNKAGRSWARIVASVLFGLNTLALLLGTARGGTSAGSLAALLPWLIGLGAIVFLWRRDSSDYFTAMSGPRVR
jgi:hypothetical protein